MPETAYRDRHTWGARLPHGYGPQVHVLADPWSLSLLARLAHPDTGTREVHTLVESGYRRLLEAAVEQLPMEQAVVPTRTGATYEGIRVTPGTRVVVVDVARAGMLPAIVFQRGLLDLMSPGGVRVDHVYMQRVTDAAGKVTGVDHTGSKIGGDVDGAVLFIPDPMAATGGSMVDAIRTYETAVEGTPAKVVVCHLMATPEYVTRITRAFPHVEIYCLRIDRGLSPEDVLGGPMGADASRERGLNDHSYIVPGAGGLGELINNTEH